MHLSNRMSLTWILFNFYLLFQRINNSIQYYHVTISKLNRLSWNNFRGFQGKFQMKVSAQDTLS